jgi:serine/threonine-protein kinase
VHGDINPANVLIADSLRSDSTRLIDLGGARKRGPTGNWIGQARIGSWAFGAPELNHHPTAERPSVANPASDLYALTGVLLYMLTGKEAFPGAREAGRAEDWTTFDQLHRDCAVAHEITDPALRAVILKGLSFDPTQRFQSADELIRALKPFAVDQTR